MCAERPEAGLRRRWKHQNSTSSFCRVDRSRFASRYSGGWRGSVGDAKTPDEVLCTIIAPALFVHGVDFRLPTALSRGNTGNTEIANYHLICGSVPPSQTIWRMSSVDPRSRGSAPPSGLDRNSPPARPRHDRW